MSHELHIPIKVPTRIDPETQVLMALPWRTGRRNHRVLYAVIGEEPSDDDIMIGSVDAPEIAHLIVLHHNRGRSRVVAHPSEMPAPGGFTP